MGCMCLFQFWHKLPIFFFLNSQLLIALIQVSGCLHGLTPLHVAGRIQEIGEIAWLVLNVKASVPVHPVQIWPLYIMIEAAELKTYIETQVKQ